MKTYAFGADVGGTTGKIGLFTTDGTLLEKWEIPTRTENNGEEIMPDIMESINSKMAERGLTNDDVQGIGLDVPGPVTREGIVQRCVNLNWGIINVVAEMAKLTDLPVKVVNDANAAALGEMWQGAAKGHKDVIMITLGTGVGGGIIVNGKIVNGYHGSGGEIGHMTVFPDEVVRCNCGRCGCVEQYASATGIVRLARLRLKKDDTPSALRMLPAVSAKDVFDCAKEGDPVAQEIVAKMGEAMALGLVDACVIVDPEVIVVGGGVSRAGEIVIDAIRKPFVEKAFHATTGTKFALAALGNDAGMYGAVHLLLD